MQSIVRLPTLAFFCIVSFLLGCLLMCNCTGKKGTAGRQTTAPAIIKSDTATVQDKDSTKPHKPTPVQVTSPSMAQNPDVIKWLSPEVIVKPDTVNYVKKEVYEELYNEYVKIYGICAALNEYDSTYQFDKGSVRMKGSVQGNELQDFQLFPTFQTTTITHTVQDKQRNSVWLGVDGLYSESSVGAGASLMFQQKRGWAIEAAAAINQYGEPVYRAGFRKRISFR